MGERAMNMLPFSRMPQYLLFVVVLLVLGLPFGAEGRYIPSVDPTPEVITSARPEFSASVTPLNWDWRNVGGISYVSNVLTQQNPNVCGSCWAEAATGALSDRYRIATNGSLQANLAVQTLLNFPPKMSGGACRGGDDYEAAHFIHKYGIADDTCLPFSGVDNYHEEETSGIDNVQKRLCRICHWNGNCEWTQNYRRYSADEVGRVKGENAMVAEIYARGPIACSLDSDPDAFNKYTSGIIKSSDLPKPSTTTDHVVVIAGYGVDRNTGMKFWTGRNSFDTQWGEGRGGGWFRLQRGNNTLAIEADSCSFAVPSSSDVDKLMREEYHPGDALQHPMMT